VDQVRAKVGAVERCGRDAVVGEFAEILAEAGAEVEEGCWGGGLGGGGEGGGRLFEEGEDARVGGGEGDGEVEEVEGADAGVGVDGPGAVALVGGKLA